MANSIFVSPGVYTREKDLTYVVRQVGVTTLGIAGETPQGPAFEPIFVSNYEEFMNYFGGLNPEKFPGNNYPKYETTYIAKSYLTQSNQLFVTRILGLTGYRAGDAWGIVSEGGASAYTLTTNSLTNCGANIADVGLDSNNVITSSTINDTSLQAAIASGSLSDPFAVGVDINTMVNGGTLQIGPVYWVSGGQVYYYSATTTYDIGGACILGTVTDNGPSGDPQDPTYNGMLLALIRSRGEYDTSEVLNYYTDNLTITDIGGTSTNPFALFNLGGTVTYGPQTGNAFNYEVSFDTTQRSYITRVLGVTPTDADPFVFVEEVYRNMLVNLFNEGKIIGVNSSSLADYTAIAGNRIFGNYLQKWNTPLTPFVVSEVRGNKLFRLFRFIMISDGDSGNRQVKFSIVNIRPDTKDFDLIIRDFNDTDFDQIVLERWTKLNLRFDDQNFIGRRIGTLNGDFKLSSKYIMVEMAENCPEDAFPAGFEGYLQRDYSSGPAVQPELLLKLDYTSTELSTISRLSKAYLGISDVVGIDQDMFDYKGMISSYPNTEVFWTGFTHGFHMDMDAVNCTVENATIPDYHGGLSGLYTPIFEVGCCNFQTSLGILGTPYERLRARKFTFVPYGGYDGWDKYRTKRTNTPGYVYNGVNATLGLASGVFSNYTTVDGNIGNNSDWYAYYEGIHTFDNPIAVNINVFTTPGINTIDNGNLVEEAIDMVEQQRADSFYIVTTPDFDYNESTNIFYYYTPEDITLTLEDLFDSNYTATYWPWIQMYDSENYIQVWMPPTMEVVRNIALTDNIAFPWFATAGVQRGSTTAIKARIKLRQADRDILYENRINPMATFTEEGVLIWGNKTLQIAETALNRVNVRRLLLQARKLISAVATRLLFDPNDQIVRDRFASLVNPILDNIRKERGLYDFRVVVSNDPEEYDRNEMSAKLFLKPTRALEYIIIDFIITPTGASFENI